MHLVIPSGTEDCSGIWQRRKGRDSSIPALEITASLASGQRRPDHKLPIIPVPLNPGLVRVSPSHLGKSTPRLPGLADQGKALEDPENKCLCQGQEQKYQDASAWATTLCSQGNLPLWFPIPDSDSATFPHPRRALPMAHRHHASEPSTHHSFCLKVPFPSSPAENFYSAFRAQVKRPLL